MRENDRHYRLVALEQIDGERWLFRCDCGSEKAIRRRNVERGLSRSCGCLQKERTSAAKATHGHSQGGRITPEFQAYRSMMARCYRKSNIRYEQYGGRGITVCEEWRTSFAAFLADMGLRPDNSYSLDRMDNDLPYSAENCRWATRTEQMRNRSCNLWVKLEGARITLAEAADRSGIPYPTLKARIFTRGWPADRALSEPVRPMRRKTPI